MPRKPPAMKKKAPVPVKAMKAKKKAAESTSDSYSDSDEESAPPAKAAKTTALVGADDATVAKGEWMGSKEVSFWRDVCPAGPLSLVLTVEFLAAGSLQKWDGELVEMVGVGKQLFGRFCFKPGGNPVIMSLNAATASRKG